MTGDVHAIGVDRTHGWTFLTNHARALVCIGRDPEVRLREIAEEIGITERAAQSIVADLVAEGYVERTRVGRRNRYALVPSRPFRHPSESGHRVDELLRMLDAVPARRDRRSA